MVSNKLNKMSDSIEQKKHQNDEEFDVIECINKQFPDEQSLGNIEERMADIRDRIKQHDDEISRAVRGQTIIENDGRQELDKATSIISELKQRISDMKNQAKKSEQTVNEITCDIKQLDNAKRNLTSAVTMLNNLHILVESVEKLKEVYKSEYRQAASILAGIQDVMRQFANVKHIPQIGHLSNEIEKLCDEIQDRINLDFNRIFDVPFGKHSISKEDCKLIAEACLVISLLGDETKEKMIKWLLELQLADYEVMFKESQIQLSSLNGVDKRFAWFKKHLLQFEEKYGFLFPPPWEMSERLAVQFCKITNESLSRIMKNNPNEVKLDPLMYAMSKTSAFEALLAKRFSGITLIDHQDKDEENDVDRCEQKRTSSSNSNHRSHPFEGLIFSTFEPHFTVFIESQEVAIQRLMEQFVEDHQKLIKSTPKSQQSRVFNSSNLLFQQYKTSLVHCIQFTNKTSLLDLHDVFKKYLRDYALRVLQIHLKHSASGSNINKMTSDSSGKMFSVATSGAAGLLQSLLRDDGRSKMDPNHVCSVILTADYCLETTQQLEKKLRDKIYPSLITKIDMKLELDLFNELIKTCIELLIHDIESACESGFNTMIKTNWTIIDTPVGHSAYVDDITNALQTQVPIARSHLKDGRKYFVQLCNKFITLFTHKYITNLFRCKILSQGGAEQLLLDTHTLKKILINLPCHNLDIKTAPSSYTKAAIKGMSKAEMVLKVVLVPHNSIDSFIESYHKLLPESNEVEFQRILDVKGVKRAEAAKLLDAYQKFNKKS